MADTEDLIHATRALLDTISKAYDLPVMGGDLLERVRLARLNVLKGQALAVARIQYLIPYVAGPDGTFTFPDGDTWTKS